MPVASGLLVGVESLPELSLALPEVPQIIYRSGFPNLIPPLTGKPQRPFIVLLLQHLPSQHSIGLADAIPLTHNARNIIDCLKELQGLASEPQRLFCPVGVLPPHLCRALERICLPVFVSQLAP